MNFQFSIFKLFFILILIAVFLPFLVLAQEGNGLVPCGTETNEQGNVLNPCTLCDIFVLIDKVIAFILKVSIPIAVLVIAYGGILMVSAGGSEDRLKKGKSAVTSAVIGLFLVFGAWLIIDFVLGNLLQEGGIYWNWEEFPKCK